jgi:hypothetical protein
MGWYAITSLQEELIMLILLQTGLPVKMQLLKWHTMRSKLKWQYPTTVHCDHLIQAKVDAVTDLARAKNLSNEVLIFFQCLINMELVF